MNKRGITISPEFLLGLLLGIAMLGIGIWFLGVLVGPATKEVKTDSYTELLAKLNDIKDGESFTMTYKTDPNGFVIGYDLEQTEAFFKTTKRLNIPSESSGFPLTVAVLLVGTDSYKETLKKPIRCGEDKYACICLCPDDQCATEERNCHSLKEFEKIDGPNFIEILLNNEVLETDNYKTFFIPPVDGKSVLLNVRKEGKTIFINS